MGHEVTETWEEDGIHFLTIGSEDSQYKGSKLFGFPSEKAAKMFGQQWSLASGDEKRLTELYESHQEAYSMFPRFNAIEMRAYLDYAVPKGKSERRSLKLRQ
tara:strand:+ start:1277 stop:1582 length:306 start_codon:yes stop_codon:yes gene_type:complete